MTFDEDKLLGGAIRDDVRIMNVETPAMPTFDDILKDTRYLQGSPLMAEYLHGVADLNYTNDLAMFQYQPAFEGEREVDLHNNLTSLVTGKGAKHDHPLVARTILESFKHMPKLARLYGNA